MPNSWEINKGEFTYDVGTQYLFLYFPRASEDKQGGLMKSGGYQTHLKRLKVARVVHENMLGKGSSNIAPRSDQFVLLLKKTVKKALQRQRLTLGSYQSQMSGRDH